MNTWCLERSTPHRKSGLAFKACPVVSYMMALKPPTAFHLFVHPSLKNKKNYGKAPLVSSYPQSSQANLFARLFPCPQARSTPPCFHRHTSKHLLYYTFSSSLTNN